MSSPFFSKLIPLMLLSNLAASCGQLPPSNHELGNFKSDSPRSGVEQSWDPFWAEFGIDRTEDNFDFPAAQSHTHLQPKNNPRYTQKASAETTTSIGLVAKSKTRSASKKRHAPIPPDNSTMHPHQHSQRKEILQSSCSATPPKSSYRPTRTKKRARHAAHSIVEAATTTVKTKRRTKRWPRQPYTCPECHTITENIYYLAIHFLQQHDMQKCAYTCRYITRKEGEPRECKKRLATRSTASSHLRVHLNISTKRGLRLPENWFHMWMTRDPDKEEKLHMNLANTRRKLAQHSYGT